MTQLTGIGFPPEVVFDHLYRDVILQCGRKLKFYGLVEVIKRNFLSIAVKNEQLRQDSALSHEARIQEHRAMAKVQGAEHCAFCIVQPPSHTLDCRHRLCSSCILARGLSLVGTWHYELKSCPLCRAQNLTTLPIQPLTAGDRVLVLGGDNAENIWQFLKDLERCIGLKLVNISELFDEIRAYGVGMLSPQFGARSLTVLRHILCPCCFSRGMEPL